MSDSLPEEREALPAAVNLPLLAEDVTFDISIKRAAPEERTAALEEKRAGLTPKRQRQQVRSGGGAFWFW